MRDLTNTSLKTLKGLSAETTIPERTLRTLYQSGKIPFLRIGHRTLLFDVAKVLKALERFEVREIR